MNKIPTQFENPTGLHQRYRITKLVKKEIVYSYVNGEKSLYENVIVEQNPDPNAEYFVMRLDEGGKDPEHIKACRIGVNAYADAIANYLPELAKDLKERYPINEAGERKFTLDEMLACWHAGEERGEYDNIPFNNESNPADKHSYFFEKFGIDDLGERK